MNQTHEEWLQGLKAGDEVIVSSGFAYRDVQLETVERVTPAQILVGNQRFHRKNGQLVGAASYHITEILQPTDKLLAAVRRKRAIFAIEAAMRQSDKRTLEALEAAAKCLEVK